MLTRSRFLCAGDYRSSSKIGEEFNNVLNRSGWPFDHVAVDIGSITAPTTRMTRDLIGEERDAETVKIVHRQLTNVLLRRVLPKKSLAIFFDGSEPLWKLRHSRLFPGKKFEGKFYRSCASPMAFQLEDKLKHAAVELRTPPHEFLVSGAATPGPVEGKLSAWMLDLATRRSSDVSRNDSICLIGGTDLFLSALGATPFHNITVISPQQGELKSMTLTEALEWLALDGLLKGAGGAKDASASTTQDDHRRLASVRTDVVLLYLISNGISATALQPLSVGFSELMDAYKAEVNLTKPAADVQFIFSEGDDELRLQATVLERVLSRAVRRTMPARRDQASAEYLEVLLQSHAMFCVGGIRNHGWTPQSSVVVDKLPKVPLDGLIAHLKHIASGGASGKQPTEGGGGSGTSPYAVASCDRSFALTAAESLLVAAPTANLIEQIIPVYSNGYRLPSGIAEDIVNTKDVHEAVEKARQVLSVLPRDEEKLHRAMIHMPTHYFVRKAGSRGPPPGWEYHSVNLGIKAEALHARRVLNESIDAAERVMESTGAVPKDTLYVWDAATKQWANVPCGSLASSAAAATSEGGAPSSGERSSTLSVLTWNVQFNRHSGERTPLGRDGIDWCTTTRYVALSKILAGSDADVIAMQEVEPEWWQYLSAQPWVQERYALSCGEGGHAIQPWGVLMLVKRSLHVEHMFHANIPAFSGHTSAMPQVTLSLGPNEPSITLASMHLLAPYNQNNVNNRVTQLENFTKSLKALRDSGRNSVVMGDFNDYPPHLYLAPPELGFKDAWLQLHSDADDGVTNTGKTASSQSGSGPTQEARGFTIDGERNPYAGKIIEPEFFGRADRVLFSGKHIQPIDVQLVGTEPVRSFGITTLVSNGAPVPEYLHPSDHFGILVEFQIM